MPIECLTRYPAHTVNKWYPDDGHHAGGRGGDLDQWRATDTQRYLKESEAGTPTDTRMPLLLQYYSQQPECKQMKYSPTDGRTSQTQNVHTTEQYSAVERRNVLIHPILLMHLEDMLCEDPHIQENKYCRIPRVRNI